jgi:BlaI family transcriptional regulator, penicillinase repressor
MARQAAVLPTSSELEILQIIWQRGPSTVREVYRTLAERRDVGYSTVLKFMQIMADKGTLVRDETVRPQRYRPAQPRQQTQRGGSSASLIVQALADRQSTADERRQIRELLDRLDAPNGSPNRKVASK